MNLKKFKKSLVSIVLGSSLSLVSGGGIFQQTKAWLPDEFINSQFEKYKDNPEMTRIILVLKIFSDLRQKLETDDILDNIYRFSLLRETHIIENSKFIKYISSQYQQEESLRLAFVKAMIVATDKKSVCGPMIESDSTKTDILKNNELFEELHMYSQIFKEETTEILRDELDQIFSEGPLADGKDKQKLESFFKSLCLMLFDKE